MLLGLGVAACEVPEDDPLGAMEADSEQTDASAMAESDGGDDDGPAADLDLDPGVILGRTVVLGPEGPVELTYENRHGIAIVGGDVELGPVDELPPPEDVDLASLSNLSIDDATHEQGFTAVPIWGEPWPNGIVYYMLPDTGWPALDAQINQGIATMEAQTNFDFIAIPAVFSPFLSHIHFSVTATIDSGGLSDSIGRKGGRQHIRFSVVDQFFNDPPSDRLVLHELGHALGLFHEHQRPDRNDFVVYWPQCVEEGQHHNFHKVSGLMWGPYDVSSVMHYRASTLGDACDPLMSLTGATLGGDVLSNGDIAALNWSASF